MDKEKTTDPPPPSDIPACGNCDGELKYVSEDEDQIEYQCTKCHWLQYEDKPST